MSLKKILGKLSSEKMDQVVESNLEGGWGNSGGSNSNSGSSGGSNSNSGSSGGSHSNSGSSGGSHSNSNSNSGGGYGQVWHNC